jgi:hypothetical protein
LGESKPKANPKSRLQKQEYAEAIATQITYDWDKGARNFKFLSTKHDVSLYKTKLIVYEHALKVTKIKGAVIKRNQFTTDELAWIIAYYHDLTNASKSRKNLILDFEKTFPKNNITINEQILRKILRANGFYVYQLHTKPTKDKKYERRGNAKLKDESLRKTSRWIAEGTH